MESSLSSPMKLRSCSDTDPSEMTSGDSRSSRKAVAKVQSPASACHGVGAHSLNNLEALSLEYHSEKSNSVHDDPFLESSGQSASGLKDVIPSDSPVLKELATSPRNPDFNLSLSDPNILSSNSTSAKNPGFSASFLSGIENCRRPGPQNDAEPGTLFASDSLNYASSSKRTSAGMNLSFSGCGFLGIYHVGVAACLRKYAPELPIDFIAGASAGAMAASCLLSNANLGVIRASIVRSAAEARSRLMGPLSPSFDIKQELKNGLTQVLPANAHEIVSGRLFISCTRISDGKNVLLSQFGTREELVQALLCSSFIPVFSGLRPMSFRGVRYMDGGFTDNMPVHDSATVTVSPFSGEADICPTDHTAGVLSFSVTNTNFQLSRRNMQRFVHALFPPSPEALQEMCQQGFDNTLDFLQRNNLVSCTRCSAVLSSVSLSPVTSREESVNGSDCGDWDEDDERCTVTGDTSDQTLDDNTYQDNPVPSDTVKKVYFSLPDDSEDIKSFEQSCVNCPHCRKHMQEAVMNDVNQAECDGPGDEHIIPRGPSSSAFRVVSYIVFPVTYSVKLPFRIVGQMVSLLPLPALLRLHAFTSEVAELARQALLRRRRAAATEPPLEGARTGTVNWTAGDLAAIDDDPAGQEEYGDLKYGWSAPDFRHFESETLSRLAEQFARRSYRLPRLPSNEAVSGSICPPSGPCVFVCLFSPERASAPLLCETRDLRRLL